MLEEKKEPLTLWQIKVLALALGVDYKELISGAAGYTGIEIKENRQQIPNAYGSKKYVSNKNAERKNTKC